MACYVWDTGPGDLKAAKSKKISWKCSEIVDTVRRSRAAYPLSRWDYLLLNRNGKLLLLPCYSIVYKVLLARHVITSQQNPTCLHYLSHFFWLQNPGFLSESENKQSQLTAEWAAYLLKQSLNTCALWLKSHWKPHIFFFFSLVLYLQMPYI